VVASGCDSSPFAASVDGHVIKQTAFNAELHALAGNAAYVKEQNASGLDVGGAAPGTYNATWTASVLTGAITGAVVRNHLAAERNLPSQAQLDASRVVDELTYAAAWPAFSPSYQATIVERDADLAMVETDTITPAQLATLQSHYANVFFSRVCVRTVAATSAAQAAATVTAIEADPTSSTLGGALQCYTTAQLDAAGAALLNTVLGLKTGGATTQKTSYGYQITAVTSRTAIPLGPALGRAVQVAVNSTKGTTQVVNNLLAGAHVKVNPLYGSWTGSPTMAYAVRPATASAN
jgi:hypothetical protein